MATEIRQPDNDIAVGSWATAPLWSKLNEGSGSPDGVYIICPNNENSICELSIENPTEEGTYSSVRVTVYARKESAPGDQRGLDTNLRVNGSLQGQQTLEADLPASFTQYTCQWTGLSLSKEEMEDLSISLISTGTVDGKKPREVWVDYLEIELTYTPEGVESSVVEEALLVVTNYVEGNNEEDNPAVMGNSETAKPSMFSNLPIFNLDRHSIKGRTV